MSEFFLIFLAIVFLVFFFNALPYSLLPIMFWLIKDSTSKGVRVFTLAGIIWISLYGLKRFLQYIERMPDKEIDRIFFIFLALICCGGFLYFLTKEKREEIQYFEPPSEIQGFTLSNDSKLADFYLAEKEISGFDNAVIALWCVFIFCVGLSPIFFNYYGDLSAKELIFCSLMIPLAIGLMYLNKYAYCIALFVTVCVVAAILLSVGYGLIPTLLSCCLVGVLWRMRVNFQ